MQAGEIFSSAGHVWSAFRGLAFFVWADDVQGLIFGARWGSTCGLLALLCPTKCPTTKVRPMWQRQLLALALLLLAAASHAEEPQFGDVLEGTDKLTMEGDISMQLVEGVDRFLLQQLGESSKLRDKNWTVDYSSIDAYNKSLEPKRARLAKMIGADEKRLSVPPFRKIYVDDSMLDIAAKSSSFVAKHDRLPVLGHLRSDWNDQPALFVETLSLIPNQPKAEYVIIIPDCDQTPEQYAGLAPGLDEEEQIARRLAEQGFIVCMPSLVSRSREKRRNADLTNREYLYRSAFVLGKHLIGYEVQQVLTLVNALKSPRNDRNSGTAKVGIIGYGEGGMIAQYAAAIDPRIDAVCVSGYFDDRTTIWEQPLDRNVFGLLNEFGDAELRAMIAPRPFILDLGEAPELELAGNGGAPAVLRRPNLLNGAANREFNRSQKLIAPLREIAEFKHQELSPNVADSSKEIPFCSAATTDAFLEALTGKRHSAPTKLGDYDFTNTSAATIKARERRQIVSMDAYNQAVLAESSYKRKEFFSKLDTSSPEKFAETIEPYREYFAKEVIGQFDIPLLPPNARSRKVYDTDKYVGYEIVMDVFDEVIAYGVLLLPKDLKAGEKRPVVVCQHGLEGRPQDTIAPHGNAAYKQFAAKLAERGYITFAPQNLYLGKDKFRTLQRKANPLGKTLFSIIVPQHQQIANWLGEQPFVDNEKIAFYGLSYGGKSAMRIPPLVKGYCLSICSADFNEWVDKNASTRGNYSYVWTGEYEIFEWNLGSTFNYAEMAALIAPRPFMVERGHFDGVGIDENVAYEFAKVRNLYQARLGIGDRCEIEWFVGPHTINGQGTFAFLDKHLEWSAPKP